jgi:hypothetical protein
MMGIGKKEMQDKFEGKVSEDIVFIHPANHAKIYKFY